MSDDQKLTHEDWERAKRRANAAEYECTLHVLSGNFEDAKESAERARAFNEEMTRITRILDAQDLA